MFNVNCESWEEKGEERNVWGSISSLDAQRKNPISNDDVHG